MSFEEQAREKLERLWLARADLVLDMAERQKFYQFVTTYEPDTENTLRQPIEECSE